jgi:hypothetical protein
VRTGAWHSSHAGAGRLHSTAELADYDDRDAGAGAGAAGAGAGAAGAGAGAAGADSAGWVVARIRY